MGKFLITTIRKRYWFSYWWCSICSIHFYYNHDCSLCRAGSWTSFQGVSLKNRDWFGRLRKISKR